MTLDREKYDAYVAAGFNPVAAAFACGADAEFGEEEVDPVTGTRTVTVLVSVPPPTDASNRTGSRTSDDAVQ